MATKPPARPNSVIKSGIVKKDGSLAGSPLTRAKAGIPSSTMTPIPVKKDTSGGKSNK
ncbi:hypothetical protein HUX88_31040 [Duganella sp. BJB1802]|uniref:hypothetical protein n=1 Tax=Duganella sp. BJB1802 TaxID=2744575 RepID=UPI0015949F58|nr:hypothetical protein [Duganella sp. BJB1802]NVD74920.1 hypothetical protein [Duganella sp. BJB1802]